MPVPDANTAWFTLNLNGCTDFAVYSFSGIGVTEVKMDRVSGKNKA